MISNRTQTARLTPLARPAWLLESVWPFQTFGLEVDDSVLAITDVGKGPILLFVHAGTWSFIWRDLIQRLANDFRCICFDAPGSGRSRDRVVAPVSLERVSHAVTGVIEKLDLDEVTLVAHDLGGISGLAGIARMPERIRGIVGMNAFGWRPSGAAFRGMLAVVGNGLTRELDVLTGLIPRLTTSSFGVGRHFDPSSRAAFRAGMGSRGWRAFHNFIRDARQCDNLYDEIARALAGPLSGLPLLTIFGERNDPFGFQLQWKAMFPNVHQFVVAKGNHFPMCDAPDQVAEAMRTWHRDWVAPTSHGSAGLAHTMPWNR